MKTATYWGRSQARGLIPADRCMPARTWPKSERTGTPDVCDMWWLLRGRVLAQEAAQDLARGGFGDFVHQFQPVQAFVMGDLRFVEF